MASSVLRRVVFLALMATGHLAVSACPEGCKCVEKQDAMTALCVERNFTSVPADLPPDTEELYMKGHQIRVLRTGEFSRLQFLQTLTLTQCGIESIEQNAFRGLHYVRTLNLRMNRLSRIQPYTFIGLFAMRNLILEQNPIRVIEDFAFQNVELHKLSMEQCPDLVNMSSKAFQGANVRQLYLYNSSLSDESLLALDTLRDSLVELSLRSNRRPLSLRHNLFSGFSFDDLNLNDNGISNVAFLEHVSTVRLSLEGNPVGSVDFRHFPTLKEVRSLRLGNTNFSDLNGRYFDGLTHLTQLHVSNNNISTLPENLSPVFSSLHRLSLSGNRLHCNCQLRWFRSWLTKHQTRVFGDVRCKTPLDADVLSVAEKKMTCEAPSNVSASRTNSEAGIELRCSGEGDPAPQITWFALDGRCLGVAPASSDTTRRVNVGVVRITSRSGLTPGVATYTCVANNLRGNSSVELTLDAYRLLPEKSNCVALTSLTLLVLVVSVLGHLGSV